MSKSNLDCILPVTKEGCHRRFSSVKNVSKRFFVCYHLEVILRSLLMFTFLYVKANSKENGEEILFPSFFQQNDDVNICVEIQG